MSDFDTFLAEMDLAFSARLAERIKWLDDNAGPGMEPGEHRTDYMVEKMDTDLSLTRVSRYARARLYRPDGSVNEEMATVYFTMCAAALGAGYKRGGSADKYVLLPGWRED